VDQKGLFPHLDELQEAPYIFKIDFGLSQLPKEAGILMIRGARQYGKSTWLEQQLYDTIKSYGGGSAFYLNGDMIASHHQLEEKTLELVQAFSKGSKVKRLFIDEITAIEHWESALKRMADFGHLRDVLVVTTGSRATDLRRGAEKLPGRKGKLERTTYLFTPISYSEFERVCGDVLGEKTVFAYLLSGGSPIACSELAQHQTIPEYVIELVRDWIEGEIASSGRSRTSLYNLLSVLYRFGGTPVGQAKLAREAGLANNTVAAGYLEILNDLGCVIPSFPWDQHRKMIILRKPCKFHFANVLAAVAYHPSRLRSVDDFLSLPLEQQAMFHEWLVAQEIVRRNAILNVDILGPQKFWKNDHHEVDFVIDEDIYLEVKRGKSSPLEFSWAVKQFPKSKVVVINKRRFQTEKIKGILLTDFLKGG